MNFVEMFYTLLVGVGIMIVLLVMLLNYLHTQVNYQRRQLNDLSKLVNLTEQNRKLLEVANEVAVDSNDNIRRLTYTELKKAVEKTPLKVDLNNLRN